METSLTAKQFYTPEGQKLMELENKKTAMLNRQGYYSKGVAKLGNQIAKLKIKIEQLYPNK